MFGGRVVGHLPKCSMQAGSHLVRQFLLKQNLTELPPPKSKKYFAEITPIYYVSLGVGLNGLYTKSNTFLSLMVLVFSILVYEWNRIHGITLSRKLRPFFNMSSVFATYKNLDPDSACLYAADKDKYYKWACCNVPEINSELPRTSDEKSPPNSPPKSALKIDTPLKSKISHIDCS
uniref:Uncharacterized protein n=1 Tax=Panagrolaimus sp. ES5 TaxID=591445 RepID=A0AC34G9I8_9BILA